MSEQRSTEQPEPLVTICKPWDVSYPDVFDLASGLRFRYGKAVAPLSKAEELVRSNRGWFIEIGRREL